MAEDAYLFTRHDMGRIADAVLRAKRIPRNNVQQWRERKICRQGTKEISWALTPPGEELLITPVADCMIATKPVEDEYGSEDFGYAEVGGFHTYCAGLFPGQWYPFHTSSNYFICAGAWFLYGTAVSGCDRGDYFDLKIGTSPDDVTVRQVHSPAGDIIADSIVFVAWKGGQDEYTAILDDCGG